MKKVGKLIVMFVAVVIGFWPLFGTGCAAKGPVLDHSGNLITEIEIQAEMKSTSRTGWGCAGFMGAWGLPACSVDHCLAAKTFQQISA